jgi:hypothetical protein
MRVLSSFDSSVLTAAQSGILSRNLVKVMAGGSPEEAYDGYTSCPLTTGEVLK